MREYQGTFKARKLLYSRVSVGILGLLVLFFANATWGVYKKSRASTSYVVEAQAEHAKLERREAVLRAEIARLETDEGLEEEIRSKYSVSKPGEQVIIIVNSDKALAAPAAAPEGWWGRFKKLFR